LLCTHGVSVKLSSSLPLSTLSLVALATVFGVGATGCLPHPIKPVNFDGSSVAEDPLTLDVNRKVDVLLVIDNSGSMGDEQANIAANFGPFIETLEEAGADYRIGITTTDMGGSGCTGSSGGELQVSSCLDRPEDFVFGNADAFAVACEANCALDGAALAIEGSAVTGDDSIEARPWIQSANGVDNLGSTVSTLDAFQCVAPQGISGCGWESPLEAMATALENMQNPSLPEYGFLRHDAQLAILVITDEVDCSVQAGQAAALFENGTFFAESVNYATSAVCWNAGVDCTGDSPYAACEAGDRDASGALTEDPSEAVLRPVSRYVDLLHAIAAQKTDGREVFVSVIAGVPASYQVDGEVHYADSEDEDFQESFGIGEGCSSIVNGVEQRAVPPVRLRAFAESFAELDRRNMYSVCEADYTPALDKIVEEITVALPPACFKGCALDTDASTAALDFSCTVYQESEDKRETLPECELADGEDQIPGQADACWIALSGEDMAEECRVAGQNLEFQLLRREGVPVDSDVEVEAACELSSFVSRDCPA